MINNKNRITIIGGGLAGSEAAFQLAEHGFNVTLYEMRPQNVTPAHSTGMLGELVCSNSFKSDDLSTASGLLKAEMKVMDSFILKTAEMFRVPAGNSLAVDRVKMAAEITTILENHERITLLRSEITEIPAERPLIIATGPLTSETLSDSIKSAVSEELYFYDAIAPVVDSDSIDYSKCYFKSRYNKGSPDFLNCPMTEDDFASFYNALLNAEKVPLRDFEEKSVFEACMPIEELADRGEKTLTFGPLKPVGLEDPVNGEMYHAVLQLRKEDTAGTAYNLVGCQTKMKINEQKRVFGIVPALRNAEFLKYGTIHRNTYINSPRYLNTNYKMSDDDVYFAGQISGVEGYIESAVSGLTAALDIISRMKMCKKISFPEDTAFYSLQKYVNSYNHEFVPSNFHFGLLPPLEKKVKNKKMKKELQSKRALGSLREFKREFDETFQVYR